MVEKYTWRIDSKVAKDIYTIAGKECSTVSKVVEDALKFYRDRYYMENQSTFLSQEIMTVMKNAIDSMEHRINNQSNQILSSLAIQQAIMVKVLAESLEIAPEALELYRAQSAEFIRTNNRVFNLKEVIE